jgi:hypothetical protein
LGEVGLRALSSILLPSCFSSEDLDFEVVRWSMGSRMKTQVCDYQPGFLAVSREEIYFQALHGLPSPWEGERIGLDKEQWSQIINQ